jgi:hypothetical protein
MKGRKITSAEQHCISDCIYKYWGDEQQRHVDAQKRDAEHQDCLNDCRICA